MDEIIPAIFSAPIATLLIVAGVGFLAIAVQIILSCFAMKLDFVRHGESAANILHVISNRCERLRRAKRYRYGLTPTGQQQAQALAEKLKPVPISAIFTSPLCRAIAQALTCQFATAEISSHSLELPYQITDALREYDCGILEGKSDPESWQLHQEITDDWAVLSSKSFTAAQPEHVRFVHPK